MRRIKILLLMKKYLRIYHPGAIFCIWLHSTLAIAGLPYKMWDKDYGGEKKDRLNVIVKTADGILLGGSSNSDVSPTKSQPGQGGSDFWIIKISPAGTKLWDKTYGGNGDEELTAILPTKDGGFLLGGSSNSGIGGDKTEPCKGESDFWIVKVDSNGGKQWDKTIGGDKNDFLTALAYHGNQYVLGGRSQSPKSGDKSEPNFADPMYPDSYDFWIVRVDGNANVVWDKTIGSDLDDDLDTIFVSPLSYEYVLAGTSNSGKNRAYKSEASKGIDGFGDYWIVKINSSSGQKIWDNTIGGTEDEYLSSAIQTADGGYILAGTSFSGVGEDNTSGHIGPVVNAKADYWIVKVSSDGTKLWDRTYGGLDHDLARSIVATEDGGYLIGGLSESGISGNKTSPAQGNYDYWIIKADLNGNKQWDAAYGSSNYDALEAILPIQVSGRIGYFLGGFSRSPVGGYKTENVWGNNLLEDYWIVRISE